MTAKEFWEDFRTYEEDLRASSFYENKQKYFETFCYLCERMETYCPGVFAKLIGPDFEEAKYEDTILRISCGGDRDLLLYVNRLLDAAPKIKHWEIRALVEGKINTDPKILSEPFDFVEFSIRPKDIQIAIDGWDKEKGIFDLLLLLPLNLSEIGDEDLEDAFITIFEELWGECFVAEKVNMLYFTHVATPEKVFFDLDLLEVSLNLFG
ncbi:hypothetical protein POV26_07805 [Aequorivita todarodis]|uniref:hypothetical protein n=1 Tax=Aequorivita todarodis TaxID=2036821 RepID=UPI002350E284|nr:hypothetical protein [Aequorivita todarodis]MDC8000937.1 hypothetical protein [Aequorivita todarodis]